MEEEKPLKRDIRRRYYEDRLRDPRWTNFANALKAERGNTCQICGENEDEDGKAIEVHHLGYRDGVEPWEYEDREVLVICHECHQNIHHHADELWNAVLKIRNQWEIYEVGKLLHAMKERKTWSLR